MRPALDALVDAFFERDRTLAVVDVATRSRLGLWHSPRTIPIDEIVEMFASHPRLVNDRQVLIPLHEDTSAELSTEFVYHLEDDGRGGLVFIDASRSTLRYLPEADAVGTCLAWRMRFWHPAFNPPSTPTFLETGQRRPHTQRTSVTTDIGSSTGGADEFFDDLLTRVRREREAELEEGRSRYLSYDRDYYFRSFPGARKAMPQGRRVGREGGQICELEVTAAGGDADAAHDHGLTPGIEVLVDTRKRREGFPVEAELVGVDGVGLSLVVDWATSARHGAAEAAFDAESGIEFSVAPLLDPIPYDRQMNGVRSVRANDRKRSLVMGDRSLGFDDSVEVDLRSTQLNEHQRVAIRQALRARDVCCLHGPPGTGKTRVLREVVRRAAADGDRVLVTAPAASGVDDLLFGSSTADRIDRRSLHADADDGVFVMARVGDGEAGRPVRDYDGVDPWRATVVGTTVEESHRFRVDEFDLVVVDDAHRSTVPETCIPFSKGERLVLAGDHLLLPPRTAAEADDGPEVQLSLLEHLVNRYGDDVSTFLGRQYRMHERIAAFPNSAFYGDRLTHGERNRAWTIEDLDPLVAYQVSGDEQSMPSGSFYNEVEATIAVREVDRLLHRGIPPRRIGVITPYSGQVGKIVQFLEESELQEEVAVATIDGFQDDAREAIIVSFVRSNPAGETGFLTFDAEGPRRLNVALTRAMKRCVLIGDWGTLCASAQPDANRAANVYADLHRFLDGEGLLRTYSRG